MLGNTTHSINSTSQPTFMLQAASLGLNARKPERISSNADFTMPINRSVHNSLANMVSPK